MHCIVCKKPLKDCGPQPFLHPSVTNPPAENLPLDGVAFQSYGNYGSRVFDPMDGTFLEIYVCDDCLLQAREAQIVYLGLPEPFPSRQLVKWEKDEI